jgi:hypothetical protein
MTDLNKLGLHPEQNMIAGLTQKPYGASCTSESCNILKNMFIQNYKINFN